jgi:uncharacterized damage-inducible protein DinB
MSEANRIKRQLETAFEGPAWHGPPLMENVRGVSEEAARAKPVAGAHSIWEIVNHIAAWYGEAIAVIDGKPYVSLQGDADWPPVSGTWADAVARLEAAHATLIEKIAGLSDEALKGQRAGDKYPLRILVRGIAEHNLYHAGQIGMLKRACAS